MHSKTIKSRLLNIRDLPCICMYCGEPAGDREHVYPKSIVGENTPKVWSCRECNLFASDILFEDMYDKSDYIREKIKRRYAKVLSQPEWSDEELEEMGYGMRKRIKSAMEKKRWVQKRINWITNPTVLIAMKFIQESAAGKSSAQVSAEISTIRPSELSLLMTIEPSMA